MSAVGEFPGISWKRRTIRGPINPLDKSTVVSICPKELHDRKPTIQPGEFYVPAGSPAHPSVLIVGPSSWWRDIDEDQPLLEIPVSSIQVADSVVRDYINGMLACNMADSMPGWFYVPGAKDATNEPVAGKSKTAEENTIEWLKVDYKKELEAATIRQTNWYRSLIKMGDSLWARSNGNPLAISDDMRLAAKEMGLTETKDWMKEFKMIDMVRCVACGTLKNPMYPICAACHFPDPNHPMTAKLLELKRAMPSQGAQG